MGLVTRDTSGLDLAKLYPDHAQDAKAMAAVINKLSLEQRILLALRYQEDLSWDKIAMELDVGRRMVYEMHSAILTVLAYEFGLL
jgi:DNA-directed RNA polymerase specialized sigma subunit